MNRIDQKFRELREKKKKAFIAFITAGDPSLRITEQLVLAFEKAGVDIIELGVPFSDPLADGPTIQASSQRALEKGVNLEKIFELVRRIRHKSMIPLALMTYYNPVLHYGEEKFVSKAQACGVDGLIIPDLPPEEAGTLIHRCRRKDLAAIFFIAPTTTRQRMKKIVQASTGFVYSVSLTGVTGARQQLPGSIVRQVRLAKQLTAKPICVGFGISHPEQIRSVAKIADGVIVGSAIVQEIAKNSGRKQLVRGVFHFVRRLVKALD